MLSQDLLKANILIALQQTKSNPGVSFGQFLSPGVAQSLAQAYDSYAAFAGAGPLVSRVTPGNVSSLIISLSTTPLFMGWGPGLLSYWTTATFTGPGFIPVNPTVPIAVAGVTADISLLLPPNTITVKSENEFAERFSEILHRWTTKVVVIGTTSSIPPVTSPFTVF